MNPPWRTAPIAVPPYTAYSTPMARHTRSSSSKIRVSNHWTFFKSWVSSAMGASWVGRSAAPLSSHTCPAPGTAASSALRPMRGTSSPQSGVAASTVPTRITAQHTI